ncbi:Putative major facilitator superfamily, MFS transporter superfamily [Septoria linicola]|uniref:Major facilitator superfamily, MFS transporter superfamily n=1 Tax=Septoria linicola TaxID=215465 RepID=A0A9Q9AQC3_9PEZI|nr:Putative major facilitator superfamily, MFS transporter superfamily [Septoria linicola]
MDEPSETKQTESPTAGPSQNDAGQLTFAPDDDDNPKRWSTTRKCILSFTSILLVFNATFASSGPSGVLPSIREEMHVGQEVASLTISVFVISNAVGPLLWAPLSLLVDIWDPVQRGNVMALFSIVIFCGPALGPIVAGYLQLKKDWRWFFYVLLWPGGASLPLVLMLPETLPSKILRKKAARERQRGSDVSDVESQAQFSEQSLSTLLRIALTRPWRILIDPISLACTAYTALIYMLLYMLFAIYPLVFRQMRGWNTGLSELPLLGIIVGSVIGGLGVFWMTRIDQAKAIKGHQRVPEDRLPLAMMGGILFPMSMFAFAWTAQYNSIHWIVPTLAGTLLAVSFLLISVAYLNYLADAYGPYAASALAANAVCRAFCGAAAPLFTTQMFKALTVAGGGSLIAGVGCLLAVAPFVFFKYGKQIRRRSKFASSIEGQLNLQGTSAKKAQDS